MANRIPNPDLDNFRRELEEDILRFDETKVKKELTSSSHHKHRTSGTHYGHTSVGSDSQNINSINSSHQSSASSHSHSLYQSGSSHHKKQADRRKHRRKLKAICIILSVIILLTTAGYGFMQWELSRINRNNQNDVVQEEIDKALDTEDKYGVGSSDVELISDPNITNILLIGQDREEGQKAEMRSDAMIICSINSKSKEITLCSLMRDMYVPVPGYGYGMINHTYMIGGFDLLKSTIEENFAIPIDGYVEVDFNRFMNLIDLLGGVDVSITAEEATYINKRYGSWNLTSGVNRLTAEQALYYCRIRQNIGGDWGRTDRQRKVIMSSFNQLKSSGAKSMVRFAHEAMPSLTTNLTNTKLIKYAYALVAYSMSTNHSYRIPVEGTYTQEVKEETLHVLVPDLEKNAKAIQTELYSYK